MIGLPLLITLLGPPPDAPPLARLASRLAQEIQRDVRDRAVEVPLPRDPARPDGQRASDFHTLLTMALRGKVDLTEAGPRLKLECVLSEEPRRLVVSGRLTEEPAGRLVELYSLSVESETSLLRLATLPPPSAASFQVLSVTRTPSLEAPVTDLAFFEQDGLIVLSPESVALYRLDAAGLTLQARHTLGDPRLVVRRSGGLIVPSEREASLWVMTNHSPEAVLLSVEEGRFVERLRAAALPWSGCPTGLRFRPGTNVLEGDLSRRGHQAFLALESLDGDVIVTEEGRLTHILSDVPRDAPPRAGPTLAVLWKAVLVASGAGPPAADDSIQFLTRAGSEWSVTETLPVRGAVRALAARDRSERQARLVAAIEEPGGQAHLLVYELSRGTSGMAARTSPTSTILPCVP